MPVSPRKGYEGNAVQSNRGLSVAIFYNFSLRDTAPASGYPRRASKAAQTRCANTQLYTHDGKAPANMSTYWHTRFTVTQLARGHNDKSILEMTGQYPIKVHKGQLEQDEICPRRPAPGGRALPQPCCAEGRRAERSSCGSHTGTNSATALRSAALPKC
jgi:hypothetical protein